MIETFPMVPAPVKAMWVIALIGALLLALLVLFAYVGTASQRTRFELSNEGLAIRGTLYGRSLPWSALRMEDARVVDLTQDRELRPTLRTNGVGLPGYQVGWFSLGKSGRGLLFLSDRTRVLAVPTTEGYTLLMSTPDPAAFLDAMRTSAPPRA